MSDRPPEKTPRADFESRAGELLRASAAGLDAATRSRLNRARQAALAELQPRRLAARPAWAGLGVAAALLLAVALRGGWLNAPAPAPLSAGVDPGAPDFEMLLADDSLEMLEDLDFYAWLAVAELEPPVESAG